jgi:NAD(P)-dependent dehydrogenase (short-subunit alcohol dehydrogenase family)
MEVSEMPPLIALADRVALVTGASSGIGRASALALATAGARVVVADVNVTGGEETVALIAAAGGEAAFVAADVADSASVDALVNAVIARYGRLDCAHNNAGIELPIASLADAEEHDWDRGIAVNLKSVWLCMRAELRQMLAQGGGVIVNTSSVGGLTAVPGNAIYCAAKHGVIGLTRTAPSSTPRATSASTQSVRGSRARE